MTQQETNSAQIIILGGGATGFYAARDLMNQGFSVLLLNRDQAIGGGTRYFIRYDKDKKMKLGLLRAFTKILEDPQFLGYYGNISVGEKEALSLEDLLKLSPKALVLATGSRGKKALEIEGIDLKGVYNAYDIAQSYNQAPGYEKKQPHIGKHVAILGVGNVTADIIYWLTHEKRDMVKDITIFARRGPFEFKMKQPEVKEIINTIDPVNLIEELKRVLTIIYEEQKEMQAQGESLPYFLEILIDSDTGGVVLDERTKEPKPNPYQLTGDLDQDVDTLLHHMLIPEEKIEFIKKVVSGEETFQPDGARVSFHFLTQPEELEPDESGTLGKIHLSHNKLILGAKSGRVKAIKIECENKTIPINTFIYSIGSIVDETLGVENDRGWPITDKDFPYRTQYKGKTLWAFGWARRPSKGLVGEAKQDVANGIWDLINTVKEDSSTENYTQEKLETLLKQKEISFVTKEEILAVHHKELEEKKLLSPLEITQFLSTSKKSSKAAVDTSI